VSYRAHSAPTAMFFGYDPVQDLPGNHLAWLVERVVEEALQHPALPLKKGQPAFDPRLCAKVLLYGYATGIRSSRQLERQCRENLPFLLLTRGDTPSYRTLCYFRVEHQKLIEEVWISLFGVAEQLGMQRLGRIVVDSSKFRADASPESVIKAEEYTVFREQLQLILKEAQDIDANEDQNPPGATSLDTEVKPDQMREIIRAIRKRIAAEKDQTPTSTEDESASRPSAPLGPRMLPRIKAALDTLDEAEQEGLKHACLTDPDARMMGEGRDKPIKECHSFEVAVDVDAALLVAAGVTQQHDNSRLKPLCDAAQLQEPCPIVSADADSGYYKGEVIAQLQEEGIDTCVPDGSTAKRMRCANTPEALLSEQDASVALRYDAQRDVYVCAADKVLSVVQTRKQGGRDVKIYRSETPCTGCALAAACLRKATSKYRITSRAVDADNVVDAALVRFEDPLHRQRYHNRGKVVETVFAFVRHVLGFSRWTLRGKERVSAEGTLIQSAYQFRKVYCAWSEA
jgi:transposase